MTTASLSLRFSADWQQHQREDLEGENALLSLERQVILASEEGVFIPDHLSYGCTEGVKIFKLNIGAFSSHWVMRVPSLLEIDIASRTPEHWRVEIDSTGRGVVDKIYFTDEDSLWAEDLTPTSVKRRLLKARLKATPIVVLDAKGQGLNIYFIGEVLGQTGVFLIKDSIKKNEQGTRAELIIAGDFLNFFMRYGQLWVVPRAVLNPPFVLTIPNHRVILLSGVPVETRPSQHRYKAWLVWDENLAQELLIFMNESNQLNTWLFKPPAIYGRSSFRRWVVDN